MAQPRLSPDSSLGRPLELLAPARNLEVGQAALMAGADAIYIGGVGFGARAAAGNSMADIATLCTLAHRLGARVYLTVNTLLYDEELPEVAAMLREARAAGVDALIVQDVALLALPEVQGFELHASTQMNIDSLDKIAWCRDLGMAQVVLPREFSLAQIKQCTAAFPDLRFEVFVSGAMCVSVSGACFISEYMTGRSANRGACAQICRLPMELYHTEPGGDQLIASGHLLSMKDNLRLPELPQLVAAGARSFKIEGRLKERDYVVNQVTAFRQELDAIIAQSAGKFRRASLGVASAAFVPDVTKTFNRGFTSAYLRGDNHDLVDVRTPKSLGEPLGRVTSNAGRTVALKLTVPATIANGDSFTFFDAKGDLTGFRCNTVSAKAEQAGSAKAGGKVSSVAARAGETVYLSLAQPIKALKVGVTLQRNVDTLFIKAINQPKALSCKVPLRATLRATAEGLTVRFADGWDRAAEAFEPWAADMPPLKCEVAVSKLQKLGDELLSLKPEDITVEQPELMGPMALSTFNALRRQALERYRTLTERTWAQSPQYLDPNNPRCPYPGLPSPLPTPAALTAELAGITSPKLPQELPPEQCVAVFTAAQIDRRLITNAKARALLSAATGELPPAPNKLTAAAVMTCRHCLVQSHARCHKDGGSTRGFYLQIGKHQFDVVTDCRRCLMYLVPRA